MSRGSKLLPRKGEKVIINGIVGSEETFNGQRGTTVAFDQGTYCVRLEKRNEPLLEVKLDNICSLSPDRKEQLHVFIPCHISTDRRVEAFLQTAKSVLNQVSTSYSVFVGLSGPAEYRKIAIDAVASLTLQSSRVQLYLQDDQVEERSQLEHIYSLLQDSLTIQPQALVMFVDNDDMCHPQRFFQFLSAYKMASLPEENTLAIPCKLLLSDKVSSKEGQYENLVNPENPNDFGHWKQNHKLRRNVTLATNSLVKELDAEEYFDFIVPSLVLQKFFAITPKKIRQHRFCDLRLYAYLEHLFPFEMDDNAAVPWLMAHYKISEHDKKRAFDRHGVLAGGPQSVDQASWSLPKAPHRDVAISKRFRNRNILSPDQVSACRGHLESIAIQFYGWNHEKLQKARRDKIDELNQLYGKGFGEVLWGECEDHIASLFGARRLYQDGYRVMWIALVISIVYYLMVHNKAETTEERIRDL